MTWQRFPPHSHGSHVWLLKTLQQRVKQFWSEPEGREVGRSLTSSPRYGQFLFGSAPAVLGPLPSVKLAGDPAASSLDPHPGAFNTLAECAAGQAAIHPSISLQYQPEAGCPLGFCPQTAAAKSTSLPASEAPAVAETCSLACLVFEVCRLEIGAWERDLGSRFRGGLADRQDAENRNFPRGC